MRTANVCHWGSGVLLLGLLLADTTCADTANTGIPSSPADTRHAGFVDITEVIPTVALDIRYYTPFNFVGKPVDGYKQPKCLLSREAATALMPVQEALLKQNLTLKIYDCYRPQQAVDHFVRWAKNLDDTQMQAVFYPTVDKKDLFKKGYISARSGHSRGSTLDLTITPYPPPPQAPYTPGVTFTDNSIDMGTGFDYFDPLSHTDNPQITGKAHENRMLLKQLMEKHGFKNIKAEWWHFTLKNEPFHNEYFHFPVE
jgi:D-alanyl-D-alanine dipeptidase